jgi:hypothetical protein
MSPVRLLFVAAAVAVVGFLLSRKSSEDSSETPPLKPTSAEALRPSVNTRGADRTAVSEAAPWSNDRRPAGTPPTPAGSEFSTESMSDAPQAVATASKLKLQGALVAEIALLEVEWRELNRSLAAWTKGGFEEAWRRNDYFEFDAVPSGREIEGKLVSIRRSQAGRYQMVTLPRASFERAYRIFDLCRDKSEEIQKKKAELVAAQSSAWSD